MSVNHSMGLMILEGFQYGQRIGVHDLHTLSALVSAAFESIPARIESTEPERLSECIGAPLGRSNAASSGLISEIIGTQQVAMCQKRRRPVKVNDQIVTDEGSACFTGKLITHQEVSVASLKENVCSSLSQRAQLGSDFTVGRGQIVIAKIGIEKITENEQLF